MRAPLSSLISSLISSLPGAVFPPHCLLCDAPGNLLCAICRDDAQAGLAHTCTCCGLPLRSSGNLCGACLNEPPFFDTTLAATIYAPPFDQLVLGLKFHAQLAYAPVFAELLKERVTTMPAALRPDLLLPVPLSHNHLATRGFNQALEIARPLGHLLGIPVDHESVMRVLDTLPQSLLPHDARQKNIRHAFVVRDDASRLQGLHVGLVDDVMTTGSTLNELARTLKQAGVARITNLALARAI